MTAKKDLSELIAFQGVLGANSHVACSQAYPDKEHIIIDGGSTDGTFDTILQNHDKLSRIISEKDRGIYDPMNKGVSLAEGDIIGFLNSDDKESHIENHFKQHFFLGTSR